MKNSIAKTTSILVIEDDPHMLQLLKRTLETEGYDVYLAADGLYGMSLLRDMEPDLVLLDIMMPGPDGYQVLDSIRHHSDVPVIMVRDDESFIHSLLPYKLLNVIYIQRRNPVEWLIDQNVLCIGMDDKQDLDKSLFP